MALIDAALPKLRGDVVPPTVRGTADLAHRAYAGQDPMCLRDWIATSARANPPEQQQAAQCYDNAIAHQLAFRRAEGLNLLDEALQASVLFRVASTPATASPISAMPTPSSPREPALRLLALMAPGDLMTNTPLDFLTRYQNIRLDLLYLLPDRPLPTAIPDHDVAFFAIGEADASMLARLRHLFATWPRPVLNNPDFLPAIERETLSHLLADLPGICSPRTRAMPATALRGVGMPGLNDTRLHYPCLIRPYGSHAGAGLIRADTQAEVEAYLRSSFARDFYISDFHDYAGPDGLFRKLRVAFIDRVPFLCHMAISRHWMVHYLNAGMTDSAEKRAEEAGAMADFEHGFARRHAAAFDRLHQRLGFDYYSIDCAETSDGRLLVFEADTAAIIHLMDPGDLFPYKAPQMRRVFAAFEAMARGAMNGQARTPAGEPATGLAPALSW